MVYGHLMEIDDSNGLYHFGIKGMKWGVRRKSKGSSGSSKPSTDYKNYKALRSRSTSSLSNKQLRTLNERMQLESTNAQLVERQSSFGKRTTKKFLSTVGNQALGQVSGIIVTAGIAYLRSRAKARGMHVA